MNRRTLPGLVLAALGIGGAKAATPPPHRMVVHIDDASPAIMNEALSNILNLIGAYTDRNEAVEVELVANGPGYAMLRDSSPVRARIADLHRAHPGVVFSACQNSRKGFAQAEGKRPEEITELPEATDVPAGIARLCDLQQQGWAYYKV